METRSTYPTTSTSEYSSASASFGTAGELSVSFCCTLSLALMTSSAGIFMRDVTPRRTTTGMRHINSSLGHGRETRTLIPCKTCALMIACMMFTRTRPGVAKMIQGRRHSTGVRRTRRERTGSNQGKRYGVVTALMLVVSKNRTSKEQN